jgi:hypothetical protein
MSRGTGGYFSRVHHAQHHGYGTEKWTQADRTCDVVLDFSTMWARHRATATATATATAAFPSMLHTARAHLIHARTIAVTALPLVRSVRALAPAHVRWYPSARRQLTTAATEGEKKRAPGKVGTSMLLLLVCEGLPADA